MEARTRRSQLLHDALEDQRDRIKQDEIAARFGERVLAIVEACTDEIPGSIERTAENSWDRKERYLVHLETVREDALLVSCADKLHNARSIVRDLEVHGESVWDRFNVAATERCGTTRGWWRCSASGELRLRGCLTSSSEQ